jgi:AcrR family transcriptional regulator
MDGGNNEAGPAAAPSIPDAAPAPGSGPAAEPAGAPLTAAAPPTAVGPSATADPRPARTGPLTARQEARRSRILAASTALACRGGFDAVQMREVAETSAVALGTLYRYFPSKIHLLVAVMEDQLVQLHTALRTRPPTAPEPGARVADTLLRAFRALQREPLLADAMVRAVIFADRSVREDVAAVSRLTTTIILEAVGPAALGPDGMPSAARLSAVRVIEHTWHAVLVAWLSGRATVDEVAGDLRTACSLLDA